VSDFLAFMQIGVRHIMALDAADHILFLLVLAAIYRGRDWRAAVVAVSAFTIGHALTLVLAATNTIAVPSAWVEFLIPVTIVATGVENLLLHRRIAAGVHSRRRPYVTAMFGLVHGAGFAGYLRSLFMDDILVPLIGFNVGIEIGQLVILSTAVALFWALDRVLTRAVSRGSGNVVPHLRAFQFRMMSVSAVVALVATGWAWERLP
jgi:hypothetical protein